MAGMTALVMVLRARQPVLSIVDAIWHWRMGQLMVASRSLVTTDPFSYLTDGRIWQPNQWGTELVVGLADALGGLPAVAVAATLLVGAAFAVVGYGIWRQAPTLVSVGLFGLVVASAVGNLGLRGNLFGFVFLPLLLLELRRPSGPRPWRIFVLVAAWTNFHAGALAGLAAVAIHAGAATVLRRGDGLLSRGGLVVLAAVAGVLR